STAERAKDIFVAAQHGAPHPRDLHAHGRAHLVQHEVAHGPAEPHDVGALGAHLAHGAWHGPHESPPPMMFPLMVLALGSMIAGFVGVPVALGGGNAIERFLEPSFTAAHATAQAPGVRPNDVLAGADLSRGRTGTGEVRALEHAPGAAEESGGRAS